MTRNRLYALLGISLILGYGWLFYALTQAQESDLTLCLMKNFTGFPCPSCGSTRAVILIMQGRIAESVMMNPIGIVLAVIMLAAPLWLAYDLIFHRSTFHKSYLSTERLISRRWTAAILLILVLANWAWNFSKGM